MKLNLEQIKSITTGVVRVEKEVDKISFHRFTDQQVILPASARTSLCYKECPLHNQRYETDQ